MREWDDDEPTRPGVRPVTELGTSYHLDRRVAAELLTKEQILAMLLDEQEKRGRAQRALAAIAQHPEHALAIARVVLRTLE